MKFRSNLYNEVSFGVRYIALQAFQSYKINQRQLVARGTDDSLPQSSNTWPQLTLWAWLMITVWRLICALIMHRNMAHINLATSTNSSWRAHILYSSKGIRPNVLWCLASHRQHQTPAVLLYLFNELNCYHPCSHATSEFEFILTGRCIHILFTWRRQLLWHCTLHVALIFTLGRVPDSCDVVSRRDSDQETV